MRFMLIDFVLLGMGAAAIFAAAFYRGAFREQRRHLDMSNAQMTHFAARCEHLQDALLTNAGAYVPPMGKGLETGQDDGKPGDLPDEMELIRRREAAGDPDTLAERVF